MIQRILHFIKYHNAFTVILGAVFLGFGASYAASPAVREGVYSSEETVVSVDNKAVVSADLDGFNFNLRINSITEDEAYFYVAYSYQTLAIENGVWQNTGVEKTLKVSKEALEGKDLGLYVEEELGENINSERHYLKRVQELEKGKGESKKVVAVEYSGLIGRLLNPKEKVIDMPEAVTIESNVNGNNPIYVRENFTPEPSPGPVISDNAVEASTSVATPTPAESLSPTASGSELPTPTPSDTPIPTPSETPTLSPTPEPTPESIPEPTPGPISTPVSTPEPTPESSPEPIPEPTPEPTTE